MTSVLNVDEIAAKNGTSPVAVTKQHAAKAWIHLEQGSTHTNRDSFGISSITDNAAGTTTMSLTNSMSSAFYAKGGQNGNLVKGTSSVTVNRPAVPTSSAYKFTSVFTSSSSTGAYDADDISVTIHGELA